MANLFRFCLLLSLPSFLAIGCENPAPQTGGPGELVTQPADGTPRVLVNIYDNHGTVCGIGLDWIELAAGWSRPNEWWKMNGDGTRTLIRREPYDNSLPKRIWIKNTRLAGDFGTELPLTVIPQETHLVGDLQIGDKVEIWTGINREGEEWALQCQIHRRPGGKIPPLHGEEIWIGNPEPSMHLRDQAEQDWEEKGIPIPKKYLDSEGRASRTNPPYPPVAPMPRLAKVK